MNAIEGCEKFAVVKTIPAFELEKHTRNGWVLLGAIQETGTKLECWQEQQAGQNGCIQYLQRQLPMPTTSTLFVVGILSAELAASEERTDEIMQLKTALATAREAERTLRAELAVAAKEAERYKVIDAFAPRCSLSARK